MPRATQIERGARAKMIAGAVHQQTHVRSSCDRCGVLPAGHDGAEHAYRNLGHAVTVSVLHSSAYLRPVLDDPKAG